MKHRPIIDIHTHQPDWRNSEKARSAMESAHYLLTQMDLVGVNVCGLLGACAAPAKPVEEMRMVNQQTHEVASLYPERFYGMVFTNPALPEEAVCAELDHWLLSESFLGIKLEMDVNCRDARLDLVMEKARQYQVPVLHHSWYLNVWSMTGEELAMQRERSEPADIAHLARRFPDVPIIMAHLEGCGIRGILDVADCPNVWIDTSGSLPFTGTVEFALKTIGSERILFGSDLWGRSLETQLGRIFGTPMQDDDLENILHRNANRLFHFSERGFSYAND